jgi:hypothetical protein
MLDRKAVDARRVELASTVPAKAIFIVACHSLDHARGGVVERRQLPAEFRFFTGFDPGDEMTQNIIEHVNLIFAQALAVMQEKIREPEASLPVSPTSRWRRPLRVRR